MQFEINNSVFSADQILEQKEDCPEVIRLIKSVRELNNSYPVHEPMPCDIHSLNDRWKCHDSESEGAIFEFVDGRLLYLLIRSDLIIEDKFEDRKIINYRYNQFQFIGSRKMIENGLMPNRYCPFLHS